MNWGWPQYIMASIQLVSFGIVAARYGQPKRDKYDWVDLLLVPALFTWLLYMGGFWR